MRKLNVWFTAFLFALACYGGLGAQARAAVVYNWSGTCVASCTGTATGVLTLSDSYTPGTAVQLSDLVGWSYSSTSGSYSVPGGPLAFTSVFGALPTLSGSANFSLGISNILFQTTFSGPLGGWIASLGIIPFNGGVQSVWTLQPSIVPLPSALALFGSGIGAWGLMGVFRRRSSLRASA